MKRNYVLASLLLTLIFSTVVLVNAKKPPWAGGPEKEKTAAFEIDFVSGDIISGPFVTSAKADNWEPKNVKGKGCEKIWEIEHYNITGTFTLEDVSMDTGAPDPEFGESKYVEGSTVKDFFDTKKDITISWIEHRYSRDYDEWNLALNQTNEEGHNYHLVVHEGSGEYDKTSDTWTVTFDDAYSFIQWWEWTEDGGVFHNNWKGYLNFVVEIKKSSN